jgi:iron complex transport system ATP-binding protein
MPIEAENLTVSRLGRLVLRDVSLRVEDGQCLSVIGPNGAGKSTLMAALLGILPADCGTVRLDGIPIEKLSRKHIARRLAYVPQIHEGFMGFRVRDVVEAGRFAHLEPLAQLSDEDHRAIADAVAATHIEDLLERRVDNLSGGERQKVWIAAALAQKTPALFLDEPTSALDPAHQAELIRLMRQLHAAGKTLVVICHDLNLPIALGGRVVAIRDHAIAFDGPVEAMLELDLLKRVFETSFVMHRSTGDERSIQLRV